MNYHQYYPTDVLNGEGIRCVLFVAGCIHACPGCYNESTWNPLGGSPYTQELENQIIADLKDTRIVRQGLTLTGGDPLHHRNLDHLQGLIERVRVECPDKDIWMWTGYTLSEIMEGDSGRSLGEEIFRRNVAQSVDVLIDGKFVQELHHPMLKWRGSENQKVWKFTDGGVEDITPKDLRISSTGDNNAIITRV